jgi:hypothetical protein
MPGSKSSSRTKEVNPDYVRMYYEHQYDRIKAHEEQSLNISNIVLTITALIITFGLNNRQSFGSVFILFLPTIIIIANTFAILNIVEGTKWMRQHQKRAKRSLEAYAPELLAFDKDFPSPHKQWAVGRRRVQGVIHYSFIFISIVLLVLFILEIFDVSII